MWALVSFNVALYFVYAVTVYYCCLSYNETYDHSFLFIRDDRGSTHFLAGSVSFMLIFRLNQCYRRYCRGIELTAQYFVALHGVLGVALAYIRGADEGALGGIGKSFKSDSWVKQEGYAIAAKVHIARMVLAVALGLKIHCRIAESSAFGDALTQREASLLAFDYLRVKGLLYPKEHGLLAAACGIYFERSPELAACCSTCMFGEGAGLCYCFAPGKHLPPTWQANCIHLPASSRGPPTEEPLMEESSDVSGNPLPDRMGVSLPFVMMQLLREYLYQPLAMPWGYPERVLNILETHLQNAARYFEELDRLITHPLPLAYLQHCKVLFLIFVLMYPFTISIDNGFWANVVFPTILTFGLLGFEIIAQDLENPIGDDPVDLNVYEMIHDLEARTHEVFNLSGKHQLQSRAATVYPLRALGIFDRELAGHAEELEAARRRREEHGHSQCFRAHFSWSPVPPHIFMYCLEKEFGLGVLSFLQTQRATAVKVTEAVSAKAMASSARLSVLDVFVESLDQCGISQVGLTHFICLKALEPLTREGSEGLTHDFLEEHTLGMSQRGASGKSIERDSGCTGILADFPPLCAVPLPPREHDMSVLSQRLSHGFSASSSDEENEGLLKPRSSNNEGPSKYWMSGRALREGTS